MLITPDTAWPPPGAEKLRQRWPSWAAWWSGDLDDLKHHAPATAPGGYWQKLRDKGSNRRQVHLPLAGDIARTSAELVFGDAPTITWGTEPDTDVEEPRANPVQDAWDDLEQTIGWTNTLLEAAEVCAALGGVYLRPAWDRTVADHPLLTVVRADEAIPEFRFGMLWQVTFVTDLGERDGYMWRWLEHHERGQIRHELWRGTNANIGRLVPLTERPETRPYADPAAGGGFIDTTPIRADGAILVEFIPNQLPQPLDRQPYGRADIQGQETLLDALDSTYASWLRDIDLGKSRVLVAQEMLESVQPTETSTSRLLGRFRRTTPAKVFDEDAAVFTPVPGMPMDEAGKPSPVTPVQFKIRYQEHAETAAALVEQIVSRAGFAPQSFGMHVDGQLSGTAIRRREHRSHKTKDRKRKYARPAVERFAETLMLINAALFGGPTPAGRPTLEQRETDTADPLETAQTISALRMAEAISEETAVRMAHPDWDGDQVTEELDRIAAEKEAARAAAPDPTGFETPDQLDEQEQT